MNCNLIGLQEQIDVLALGLSSLSSKKVVDFPVTDIFIYPTFASDLKQGTENKFLAIPVGVKNSLVYVDMSAKEVTYIPIYDTTTKDRNEWQLNYYKFFAHRFAIDIEHFKTHDTIQNYFIPTPPEILPEGSTTKVEASYYYKSKDTNTDNPLGPDITHFRIVDNKFKDHHEINFLHNYTIKPPRPICHIDYYLLQTQTNYQNPDTNADCLCQYYDISNLKLCITTTTDDSKITYGGIDNTSEINLNNLLIDSSSHICCLCGVVHSES